MHNEILTMLRNIFNEIQYELPLLANTILTIIKKVEYNHTKPYVCEHSGIEFKSTNLYSQGFNEAITLCKEVISRTVTREMQPIVLDEIDRRIKL